MTTISAQAILVSRNVADPDPNRKLATLLLRYPRCIHAEFLTHRVLSKNSASSRAIPVEKMIQSVIDDPFVPLYWGKNQRGMQANEECDAPVFECWTQLEGKGGLVYSKESAWIDAMEDAVMHARRFAAAGYHKQIINRLLEPWAHITVVCSGTEWDNFFALRDHPDAEPHIQILAREIRKAIREAPVQELRPGQWYTPFTDIKSLTHLSRYDQMDLIKLSVARCASASFKTVDDFDMTLERAVELSDKLLNSRPMHASPFEHQAMADGWLNEWDGQTKLNEWYRRKQHRNFTGFRQYRAMIEDVARL